MRFNDIHKITDAWFDSPEAFDAYKVPIPVEFEVATDDGQILTLEGPVHYRQGDYIMTGPKGERYPIIPERFRELYVDNGNGTATPRKIIKRARLADHQGTVKTSWGDDLHYNAGQDYIVKHGSNDYGVVKTNIFDKTYERA